MCRGGLMMQMTLFWYDDNDVLVPAEFKKD